jgi:hypothetical protein
MMFLIEGKLKLPDPVNHISQTNMIFQYSMAQISEITIILTFLVAVIFH